LAQRVPAIPTTRHARREVDFLDRPESEALPGAPDWIGRVGRRDHRLLLVALRAGMRSPETIALRRAGVHPGGGAHVRCHGKGRRERSVPLRRDPLTAPRAWLSRG